MLCNERSCDLNGFRIFDICYTKKKITIFGKLFAWVLDFKLKAAKLNIFISTIRKEYKNNINKVINVFTSFLMKRLFY